MTVFVEILSPEILRSLGGGGRGESTVFPSSNESKEGASQYAVSGSLGYEYENNTGTWKDKAIGEAVDFNIVENYLINETVKEGGEVEIIKCDIDKSKTNLKGEDWVRVPHSILLEDGRSITVTFEFTSRSDGKNGDQLIRSRLLSVLEDALLDVPNINSIDISATTNGNHKDPRHMMGLAMDIDKFNGIPVSNMQKSQMIINFQKALESNEFLHQDFGPSYNFYPGHGNHVHFSIEIY